MILKLMNMLEIIQKMRKVVKVSKDFQMEKFIRGLSKMIWDMELEYADSRTVHFTEGNGEMISLMAWEYYIPEKMK